MKWNYVFKQQWLILLSDGETVRPIQTLKHDTKLRSETYKTTDIFLICDRTYRTAGQNKYINLSDIFSFVLENVAIILK
jgi:hypothetical protein